MSAPTKLDAAAVEWLRSTADPDAWRAAEPFFTTEGLNLLALVPSAPSEDTSSELWVSGPRARLRLPVTELFRQHLDEGLGWLVQWLEGRWPRGKMVLKLPLGEERRAQWVLHAPMPPTRLLLSQGPLPLSREGVAHFKAFHSALGANHLFSGGFEVLGDSVVQLRAAWRVRVSELVMALAAWPTACPDEVTALVAALPEQAKVTLEVGYRPEPGPIVRLTFPGRGRRRVLELSPAVQDSPTKTAATSWLVPLNESS